MADETDDVVEDEPDDVIETALAAKTIAVVGCSATPGKAAHDVPAYLDEHGYEIVPENPFAEELFGRVAEDTLADVAEPIDVVCVFRPSAEVAGIVEEAVDRDDTPVVWTQRGIRDDEAAATAEAAGLPVVQDRCLMVEHRRLSG